MLYAPQVKMLINGFSIWRSTFRKNRKYTINEASCFQDIGDKNE